MFYEFETTTHGKWILTGEHAVIRGHSALAFPVHEKKLTLSYRQSTSELRADYEGDSGADMHLLFWSVLEQGMQLLGQSLNRLNGYFHLYSNIPIGVGMGASAALCVAVARWFEAQSMLTDWSVHAFAKELEHLFHGESSGLDIAVVSLENGVYFKAGRHTTVSQNWSPNWYLSSCGQIGITSHCIHQVQMMWHQDPDTAAALDQQMSESTKDAHMALEQHREDAQSLLANAINRASDCFASWGLVSESLSHHMELLREAGAIAVKPTGSGGGGYVVSLWDKPPSPALTGLIRV